MYCSHGVPFEEKCERCFKEAMIREQGIKLIGRDKVSTNPYTGTPIGVMTEYHIVQTKPADK